MKTVHVKTASILHDGDTETEIRGHESRINRELHGACNDMQVAMSTHRYLVHQLKTSELRLEYAEREGKWPLIELENRTIARLAPKEAEARARVVECLARWLRAYTPAP